MFRNRLWGNASEYPADLRDALVDLDRLTAERPELLDPGRQLAKVLRATFGTEPGEPSTARDPSRLTSSWREGIPAFRVAPPVLNDRELKGRALAICDALRDENPKALSLLDAIRRGRADLRIWCQETLEGCPDAIDANASSYGFSPLLAASVLRLALLPALARFAETLAPLRSDSDWVRGDCPNCGGWPALAEIRGLEQRRRLRCGLCAADWAIERLRCPFCGETDHRALHYRFVEGEPNRRLALCDTCGMVIKELATLSPLSPPALLVAELATVHLDLSGTESAGEES